jgi:hypothetical protein
MSADIGELARALIERKRRAEMTADELFWLEIEEEKERRMHQLAAAAQREADAASSTGGKHD